MDVTIQILPRRHVAALRHTGPYDRVADAFEKLIGWAAAAGQLGPDKLAIGLSHDDPDMVAAEALRYDACIEIANGVTPPDGFAVMDLPEGRYAVYRLTGPYHRMPATFKRLFTQWLPVSGAELAGRPCMELYWNSPSDTPEVDLITDLCIPLKPDDFAPRNLA